MNEVSLRGIAPGGRKASLLVCVTLTTGVYGCRHGASDRIENTLVVPSADESTKPVVNPVPGPSLEVECPPDMALVSGPADAQHFCLDRTEVTVKAYRVCVEQGQCAAPADGDSCNWKRQEAEYHPINCVTHSQAEQYCERKAKRLPSHKEWTFAVTKGDPARVFPWGTDAPKDQLCWQRESTCAVRGFRAGDSIDGISDLVGNVNEWTSSRHSTVPGAYIIVGGDWQEQQPEAFDVTANQYELAGSAIKQVGFRCAMNSR
jgi:formylglycine-generating enzyme required for sulfatase activity